MAMTMKLGPNMAITALLAVLLLSAAACSDRNAQARLAMTAADSLMTADPQAALDTLMTIDSTDAAGLPRADRPAEDRGRVQVLHARRRKHHHIRGR